MKRKLFAIFAACIMLLSGCSLFTGRNAERNPSATSSMNRGTSGSQTEGMSVASITTGNAVTKTGSGTASDRDKILLTVYYQDTEGCLVPVTKKVDKQESVARAALSCIVDSPSNREELAYYGLCPVLPQGTEILGIDIKQGTAVVDFNKELLAYTNEAAERNIVASIVYTLTEFNTIDNVTIKINGAQQKKLKYNTDISGSLNRDSVLINAEHVNLQQGMGKTDIYLFKNINDKYTCLVPVSVEHNMIGDDYVPDKIVELLTTDYANKKLISEIPAGTKLIKSYIKSSVLTLDFSNEIRNYGGTAREDGILKQLLYSMKQIKGVEKVKILINGKEGTLPEGTDISKEFAIPDRINTIFE